MLKALLNRLVNYYHEVKTGEKKISKDGMLILSLCGVLIYIILLPSSDSSIASLKNEVAYDLRGGGSLDEDCSDYKTGLEKELEIFLSQIDGVGEVKVLMYISDGETTSFYKKEDYKILGVVIGAQGARSETVKAQIIHLVMVLYGLDIDNVEVFPLK